MGKCPGCDEWDTLAEEMHVRDVAPDDRPNLGGDGPQPITDVPLTTADRIHTGEPELDRVFGGGLVAGSVSLVGGDPGIGKSTLTLQVCRTLAEAGQRVLYVSAEESVQQTRLRAERLGALSDGLYVVSETNTEKIKEHAEKLKPALIVVDSIQMVYKPSLASAPGSVGQVRESATELVYLAKRSGAAMFIIGHVTKEGALAGPRTLEHLVDSVFYFEGDRHHAFRILRAVKNRFGSTNEIAVFEMSGTGLIPVENPGEVFLRKDRDSLIGTAIVPVLIGSRTMLVEVQALTTDSGYGNPARRTSGVDGNRVAMIQAVLERRCGLHLGADDVYVNAVGGVRIDEPAADLGVAVAIASSFRNRPVPQGALFVGELGLAGEVRSVTQLSTRLSEAARLGIQLAVIPADLGRGVEIPSGLTVAKAKTLAEALDACDLG
jgi:DNA repair protein RadA/Sms